MSKAFIRSLFAAPQSPPLPPPPAPSIERHSRVDFNSPGQSISLGELYRRVSEQPAKTSVKAALLDIIRDSSVISTKVLKRSFLISRNNMYRRKRRVKKARPAVDTRGLSPEKLNAAWLDYFLALMPPGKSAAQALPNADLHGAEVRVLHSTDTSLVGLRGIVLEETRDTLTLAVPAKGRRRVLKAVCTFGVRVGTAVVRVHGPVLQVRSEEKAKYVPNFDHLFRKCRRLMPVLPPKV